MGSLNATGVLRLILRVIVQGRVEVDMMSDQTSIMSRKDAAIGYAGLVLLSVIWGMAFVAIKQADSVLSPVNLTLLRWFVASFFFLALLPVIGRSSSNW